MISFVGAGPGDPDLITVKGLRRLRAAEVLIHDRLVAPELLEEARHDAQVIDVGKAPGRHGMGQGGINALLVERAARDRRVVRLKGGDPTLFGRLAEEIRAVRAAGLRFEVVPGVTAGCAAASRTGISLTERGQSSVAVFATATDHSGETALDLDWDLLARVRGTVVCYMTVRNLDTIAAILIAHGRDPSEPAVVVERAARADERVVPGSLGTIAGVARAAAVESPAVLIVGPTVRAATVSLVGLPALAGVGG
ncbi:MAG: uroporphyrinogen-III C-methyltransferase [Candidatus Rokubacteria bacterium]|nr:uroporphyrinogen-III C-methyltransferase [Candidatus Rokubacteria bacterium]